MTRLDDSPDDRAETLGRPLPGADVKIARLGDEGIAHHGEVGELCTRGYHVMPGYFDDPIQTVNAIESVLFSHPAVDGVAVLGLPDDVWGEQLAAFVKPAPGTTPDEDELFGCVRARLAPHKTPRVWHFVDTFPMTPSGKIRKFTPWDLLGR